MADRAEVRDERLAAVPEGVAHEREGALVRHRVAVEVDAHDGRRHLGWRVEGAGRNQSDDARPPVVRHPQAQAAVRRRPGCGHQSIADLTLDQHHGAAEASGGQDAAQDRGPDVVGEVGDEQRPGGGRSEIDLQGVGVVHLDVRPRGERLGEHGEHAAVELHGDHPLRAARELAGEGAQARSHLPDLVFGAELGRRDDGAQGGVVDEEVLAEVRVGAYAVARQQTAHHPEGGQRAGGVAGRDGVRRRRRARR